MCQQYGPQVLTKVCKDVRRILIIVAGIIINSKAVLVVFYIVLLEEKWFIALLLWFPRGVSGGGAIFLHLETLPRRNTREILIVRNGTSAGKPVQAHVCLEGYSRLLSFFFSRD